VGLTVEPGFHCAMKDSSDRTIGFGGAKQPTPPAANLDLRKRREIDRAVRERAPMQRVKQ
jgi:hypothetical protein